MDGQGIGGRRFLGPASAALPPGRRVDAILDFPSWLGARRTPRCWRNALAALRSGGQGFDLLLLAKDGRQMRAIGWALGAGAALRVRPAASPAGLKMPARTDEFEAALLAQIPEPVAILDQGRKLNFANAAYQALGQGQQRRCPAEIAEAAGMDFSIERCPPAARSICGRKPSFRCWCRSLTGWRI